MIGYDTFNTILKNDLNEKGEKGDYYNLTVNMLVRRMPTKDF